MRDHHAIQTRAAAGDAIEQQRGSRDPDLVAWLLDGCQRNPEIVGIRDIIVANHGQVAWNSHPELLGHLDDLEGDVVVAHEDGFGTIGPLQVGAQHRVVVALLVRLTRWPRQQADDVGADDVRVVLQSVLLERPAVATHALDDAGGPDVVRSDVADPAIAELRQVLDREEAAAGVVHRHRIDGQVRYVAIDQHDRKAAVHQAANRGHVHRAVDGVQDHATGALGGDALQLLGLEPAVVARDAQQQRIARLAQRFLGAADQLGVAGAHDRWQHHADEATQSLARGVAHERAAAGDGVDHAFVEHDAERVTHRAATDAQVAREVHLRRQALAGPVQTVAHLAAQACGDLRVKGFGHVVLAVHTAIRATIRLPGPAVKRFSRNAR